MNFKFKIILFGFKKWVNKNQNSWRSGPKKSFSEVDDISYS